MLLFMQEIKKGIKSLEGSYELLEFLQEACRDQGIAEGMKKRRPGEQNGNLARCLANVEEICQRQAEIITQTRQVLQTGKGHYYAR